MSILHYIGIFEALFLALLLLFRKKKDISHFFLALYFIVFGVSIFFDFLESYNMRNDYKYPFLILITPPITLLHGPILWFYIRSLTTIKFKLKPIYILHFLPFLLMVLNLYFVIYSQPPQARVEIAKNEIFKNWINYKIAVLLISTVLLFYLGWCLRMINQFNLKAPQVVSNIDIDTYNWMKVLFFSAVILYSGFIIVNFFDLIFNFISFKQFQYMSFTFGSVFVLFLGFYGLQQSNIFSVNTTISNSALENIGNDAFSYSIKDDKIKEFIDRLIKFMQQEKPYLNPNLNVEELAKKFDVSTYYISDILNNKMNVNFLDFINFYRIEEFKRIVNLPENKNIKIAALAQDVGFNSKATFNRVFKKKMNITPSEYIQQLTS